MFSFQSDDLPTPEFMTQYLSFLGLPQPVLTNIIKDAYTVAAAYKERQWSSSTSSSDGPLHLRDFNIGSTTRRPSVFNSSLASNGSWEHIRTMVPGTVEEPPTSSKFENSFHLFGDNYPLKL